MKLVDTNVLLYAVNSRAAHHEQLRAWLETALSDEETVGLAWVVILGFLRLATHSRVFSRPLPASDAINSINGWLAAPNVKLVSETDEHWSILRTLLDESGTSGNLTTDAHLAALAIANGATLISCDNDFRRFRHLRWENPLDKF